jgi:hypothetical protein
LEGINLLVGHFGKSHARFGVGIYTDYQWRLEMATLRVAHVTIDLCHNKTTRIRRFPGKRWKRMPRLSRVTLLDVEGAGKIPVIPKSLLLGYKRIIWRPVDQFDVRCLSRQRPQI